MDAETRAYLLPNKEPTIVATIAFLDAYFFFFFFTAPSGLICVCWSALYQERERGNAVRQHLFRALNHLAIFEPLWLAPPSRWALLGAPKLKSSNSSHRETKFIFLFFRVSRLVAVISTCSYAVRAGMKSCDAKAKAREREGRNEFFAFETRARNKPVDYFLSPAGRLQCLPHSPNTTKTCTTHKQERVWCLRVHIQITQNQKAFSSMRQSIRSKSNWKKIKIKGRLAFHDHTLSDCWQINFDGCKKTLEI